MSLHPSILATLDLQARGSALVARVTFANRSTEPALLYRFNVPRSERLENNVFRGTANGERLRYTGRYVKRRAPRREDFLQLGPNEVTSYEVDLRGFYAVPDRGDLVVRYEAFHSPPDTDGVLLVQSNQVMLHL
jgi:peptidyl-Lys metalloendopeptidase